MKTKRQEYIELKSQYLFKKYYEKDKLRSKYNLLFGKLEIEKKKKIYEMLKIDKKIENRFNLKFLKNFDDEMSVNSNSLIEADIYTDAIARVEFSDLENQIKRLKKSIKASESLMKIFDKLDESEILNSIQRILEKADPYINSNSEASKVYNNLIQSIKKHDYEYLKANHDVQMNVVRNKGEVYDALISDLEKMMANLQEEFPFSEQSSMSSEKAIEDKLNELREDINKSTESLKRITNVYLYSIDRQGLIN